MIRTLRASVVALFLSLIATAIEESRGDFVTFSTPTAAYTSATTKIPVTASFGTALGAVSDSALTVTFSAPVTVTQVGPGIFGWGPAPTVEETAPPVLFSQFQLSRDLTFSRPLSTFGVEMESNNPTIPFLNPSFTLTATFFKGSVVVGTISQNLVAPGGARLFAASTTTDVFTSVRLTSSSGSGGFEFGQIRYALAATAAVPEPASFALLGTGLLGLLGYHYRRARAILV